MRKANNPFKEDSMKNQLSALMLRIFFFVAPALALALLTSHGTASAERLPTTVLPAHYALTLTPDLKTATFSGKETIDVTLSEPTDHITLNALEITFQSVSVSGAGKELKAAVTLDKDKEEATFTFPEKLPAGKATLTIAYTGILNDKLRGFYLSKADRRNYAVTQFESTDARRAFPSFDEPAFKATFDITLIIDAGDTGISNGPIVSDTPGPGADKHTLKFLTSPKMSTYLVAFLVGDFKCTAGDEDGVAIRVCSTPDKVAFTPYGLDVAKFILHYYDNYFGIHYPLKKLDLIGIPDFEAGAMENFGAITFRESDLLLDPKTASLRAKKNAAIDIAHEMAHQWFGDLVTMKWWDNTWLNEGFATWMENKSIALMHPEWNIDEGIAGDEDETLNIDAMPTTRAIRAKADTRDEIEEMFDSMSYGKASDVLLTVENYEGAETFRNGVHAYLLAHLYGNATAEDFWNAQTAASHKPINRIMDSLIAQPGEPIVTFGEPSGRRVLVKQMRFFLSASDKADPKQKWTFPVCFKTGANSEACQVVTPETTSLKIPGKGLFFANAEAKGYYRSAYPPNVYAVLVSSVETGLTPAERISLTGDEWAQVRSDKATVGNYLNLAEALKADPDEAVIESVIGGLGAIDDRVAATAEEKAELAGWVRRTYAPVYAKLGPPAPGDSPNTRELRSHLFGVLGYYGKDSAVLADADRITEQYLADPASVDPTLGQTAAAIAARNGNAALFDKLQKVYETSTNPELKTGALEMLALFEDPALAQRSLDYAVSGEVRNQDAAIQIAISLQGDATRELAWGFVKGHWDKVQTLLTPEMGEILGSATGSFCSAEARDDVKSFFATHKVPAGETAVKHATQRIDGCIEFRSEQESNLKQWLATQPRS
jgi:aminopeptidase N/puromycin-sensitive aminopeptidase